MATTVLELISSFQMHSSISTNQKQKFTASAKQGRNRESLKLTVSAGAEISLKIPLAGPAGHEQLNGLSDCPGALCGQLTTLGNPEEQDSTREQPHAGGQNLLPISGLADGCLKAHT